MKSTPTIVENAGGGYTVLAPPERHRDPTPEEVRARQKADEILFADVLAEFGWSEADYGLANGYQFPRPIGSRVDWRGRTKFYFSRHQIAVWRERFTAFAKTVK
ncbi:MAG: hypothetical protein U0Q11_13885 [Vicinamibacterales bacterium]